MTWFHHVWLVSSQNLPWLFCHIANSSSLQWTNFGKMISHLSSYRQLSKIDIPRYSFEALFAESILYPCCGVIWNLGHFWISAAAFLFASKQQLCKKLEHVVSAFFRASLHPGQKLWLTYLNANWNKLVVFRTSLTESCSSCCFGINVQVWIATLFSNFPGQVNQIMACCVTAA